MDFTALVKELGVEDMPQEEQQALIDQVVVAVTQHVSLRLNDTLTDDQKKHLDKIATEQGGEAAAIELNRIYPEYTKLYQEELDKLKDFLKGVQDKKEALQAKASKKEDN